MVMSSSPATMRSAVVFPQPDGPTNTMNSPSPIVRSRPQTAGVPSGYTFVTSSRLTWAKALPLAAFPVQGQSQGPYPRAMRDKPCDQRPRDPLTVLRSPTADDRDP